jgi:hypothetical protein
VVRATVNVAVRRPRSCSRDRRQQEALEGILSIDDIVLWGVQHGGVTRKELLHALRAVCATHDRLLRTDNLDEPVEFTPVLD